MSPFFGLFLPKLNLECWVRRCIGQGGAFWVVRATSMGWWLRAETDTTTIVGEMQVVPVGATKMYCRSLSALRIIKTTAIHQGGPTAPLMLWKSRIKMRFPKHLWRPVLKWTYLLLVTITGAIMKVRTTRRCLRRMQSAAAPKLVT